MSNNAHTKGMIEVIHQHLASVDDFAGIPRQGIHVYPLQTLPHSEVYRIRIDSRSNGFILKKPGVADVAGLAERERRFYRHIAPLLPDSLIPRCVLAVDDGQSKWLLIEDLSKTHREVGDPSKPTLEECRGLAKALATLHGLTGADSTIGEEWVKITADLPAASMDQRVNFFLTALGPFIAMLRGKVDRHVLEFLSGLDGISASLAHAASGRRRSFVPTLTRWPATDQMRIRIRSTSVIGLVFCTAWEAQSCGGALECPNLYSGPR